VQLLQQRTVDKDDISMHPTCGDLILEYFVSHCRLVQSNEVTWIPLMLHDSLLAEQFLEQRETHLDADTGVARSSVLSDFREQNIQDMVYQ
jgi:hypothetical protein